MVFRVSSIRKAFDVAAGAVPEDLTRKMGGQGTKPSGSELTPLIGHF